MYEFSILVVRNRTDVNGGNLDFDFLFETIFDDVAFYIVLIDDDLIRTRSDSDSVLSRDRILRAFTSIIDSSLRLFIPIASRRVRVVITSAMLYFFNSSTY